MTTAAIRAAAHEIAAQLHNPERVYIGSRPYLRNAAGEYRAEQRDTLRADVLVALEARTGKGSVGIDDVRLVLRLLRDASRSVPKPPSLKHTWALTCSGRRSCVHCQVDRALGAEAADARDD